MSPGYRVSRGLALGHASAEENQGSEEMGFGRAQRIILALGHNKRTVGDCSQDFEKSDKDHGRIKAWVKCARAQRLRHNGGLVSFLFQP
ncbi:hypothetical protein TNCV_1053511 [Trichonephila clavipes]|nr:hypothetical protein TNCV_1053511 [Trichonephila clavipes]